MASSRVGNLTTPAFPLGHHRVYPVLFAYVTSEVEFICIADRILYYRVDVSVMAGEPKV